VLFPLSDFLGYFEALHFGAIFVQVGLKVVAFFSLIKGRLGADPTVLSCRVNWSRLCSCVCPSVVCGVSIRFPPNSNDTMNWTVTFLVPQLLRQNLAAFPNWVSRVPDLSHLDFLARHRAWACFGRDQQ